MTRVALVFAAAAVVFAPVAVLLAAMLLLTPSMAALDCAPGSALRVRVVPSSLTVRTGGGTVTVGSRQLQRAVAILTVASRTSGAGVRGARIALMAALTESGLRMLANPAVPSSLRLSNDGVGEDHDSLGLFQMRPSTGWGSTGQLMDPTYQAEAFFGGPSGPNAGSPRGLLDIPDWSELTDGQAAQAVEVSAFPDRYTRAGPVADGIVRALTAGTGAGGTSAEAESTAVVFPLPAETWTVTARFGPRVDPITGLSGFHHGTDLAAPAGTPIRSATDGRVVVAGIVGGTGTITVLARVDGQTTAVTYLHMARSGIGVRAGDRVTAGEVIGAVGSTGHSTGPHLHLQVQPGGLGGAPVDSLRWLRTHHAAASEGVTSTAVCR